MDTTRIYQYRFDELLKIIKHGRRFERFDEREDEQIIDICGNAFREYQRMILSNESWVIYALEKIITCLFDSYGMDYYTPEYEERSSKRRAEKTRPFSFVLKENDKNTAYVFLYCQRKGIIEMRNSIKKYQGIDSVKFIFLQRDYKKNMEILNDLEKKDDNSFLKFYNLKEFFDEKFGTKEYSVFLHYAEIFNERVKNLMGYKMIAIPTNDAIENFKEKKAVMLKDFDYNVVFPVSFSKKQKDTIFKNYIDCELYKIMMGDADFADSFISSEWYYGIHTVTGAIDQTGLITGYLKSAEQLLYALIRLSIGKGRWISINPSKRKEFVGKISSERYIEFNEDNEDFADTTLGSLILFLKNKKNRIKDLVTVDTTVVQSIIEKLYTFKDDARNVHLHKNNLYTSDKVNNIRQSAICLYCLLIGSFKISGSDLRKLGVYNKEVIPALINENELYERVLEWVTPIILFDLPKDVGTVAFHISKFQDEQWNLCLQGLNKIRKDQYDTIEWNYNILYSSSMMNNRLNWSSEGAYKEELIKLIDTLKRIVNEENEISAILKKYPEVVVGDMQVLEVLHRK